MPQTKTLTVLTLCLCMLFFGCKKDKLPDAHGTRLQKMITTIGTHVNYSYFKYDAQNRLIGYATNSNNNTEMSYDSIEYNTEGKITKMTNSSSNGKVYGRYEFHYDNTGKLAKIVGVTLIAGYQLHDVVFRYDLQGRLIADTQYLFHGPERIGYNLHHYDNNNNIISEEYIYEDIGVDSGIAQVSYDDKPTAFGAASFAMYLLSKDAITYLSKNNPTVMKRGGEITRTFKYEYYSNGLPRKQISHSTVPITDSDPVSEFFYE